jgi:hypothetical protein
VATSRLNLNVTLATPGDELLVACDRHDVIAALESGDAELQRMAARARAHLARHTTAHRAQQLIDILGEAKSELRDFERTARGVLEV